jgi:DNA processing protein
VNIFGIDANVVRDLVSSVYPRDSGTATPAPEDRSDDALSERFARAAWLTIAEPGDGVAGALVRLLGAGGALTALLEDWSANRVADESRMCREEAAVETGAAMSEARERWRLRLKSSTVARSFEQAARVGARLLTPSDPLWPDRLTGLENYAPTALWCRGSEAALDAFSTSISLVGARASSGYGEHVAMESSAGLVDRGFAIVSGAAYGIDGMAHRAALASRGVTFAFLAGGVDRFYPTGHDALLGRIVEGGAVLSELPCGSAPTRWRFLQRNRLIAAVSRATIVLEAGSRSGSLNTAGHAASLGKPLGAVPGPVTSPSSAGCHRLLREYDAVCVTNAAQMAELAGEPDPQAIPVGHGLGGEPTRRSADETRVMDALSKRAARTVTEIATRAGMSESSVAATLGSLGIDGAVRENDKGWRAVSN